MSKKIVTRDGVLFDHILLVRHCIGSYIMIQVCDPFLRELVKTFSFFSDRISRTRRYYFGVSDPPK